MVWGQPIGIGNLLRNFVLSLIAIVAIGFLIGAIHNITYPVTSAVQSAFTAPNGQYETLLQTEINADLKAKNYNVTCTGVTLVNEADNKYNGVTTFSDGNRGTVELTADSTGRVVYSMQYPPAWIWTPPVNVQSP